MPRFKPFISLDAFYVYPFVICYRITKFPPIKSFQMKTFARINNLECQLHFDQTQSLHEFLSQSQSALLIATLIGEVLELNNRQRFGSRVS